jgi:hypothetical protein
VVSDRERALATLRVAAAARVRAASPATPLGLRLGGELHGIDAGGFDEDAPTCPQHVAVEPPERGIDGSDEPPPLPPPPRASVALDSDQLVAEQLVRLNVRLRAVRPAIGRLREELDREECRAERRLVDVAMADVTRALVHARRSVRALVALLSDLEQEAGTLIERAGGGRW